MNPNPASKLSLAVSQTIKPLVPQSFPASVAPKNVAKCRNLSHISRFSKTNPNPQPKDLKARQHTAIALLYQGHTVAHIARTLGLNPRTIFRWLKQPQFRAAMQQAAPVFEQTTSRLAEAQSRAFEQALRFLTKGREGREMSRNVALLSNMQNEPTASPGGLATSDLGELSRAVARSSHIAPDESCIPRPPN